MRKKSLDFRRLDVLQRNYPDFFKDFKEKSMFCRLMRLRLLLKMLLMEINLGVKVTINITITKKPCFDYIWRFVTHALTLRPRNTYFYGFRTFFSFFIFRQPPVVFRFYTKFWAKRALFFLRLNVVVCCLAANHYSEITSIFPKISYRKASAIG